MEMRELETSAIPHHIALQLLPRLQPLAKSLGERSAVVCLLYCVLVSPCSLVSSGVVGFPPVTTPPSLDRDRLRGSGVNPRTETMI